MRSQVLPNTKKIQKLLRARRVASQVTLFKPQQRQSSTELSNYLDIPDRVVVTFVTHQVGIKP
jgi:hypothetical protein